MAPPESSIPKQPSLLLPPLLTAVGIIVCVFLTLLALHLLLKKLRSRTPPAAVAAATAPQAIRASLGVDSKVLDSLGVHAYDRDSKFLHPDPESQRECCVCLSALEEGVPVRILPACRHVFHRRCVDEWFASRATCPFCRAEVSAAAESFVLAVLDENVEGSNESVARDCQHRRSSSLIWPSSDSRMVSSREKLRLKRCVSLEVICVR